MTCGMLVEEAGDGVRVPLFRGAKQGLQWPFAG